MREIEAFSLIVLNSCEISALTVLTVTMRWRKDSTECLIDSSTSTCSAYG
jgi:hypothetical protein